MQFAGWYVGLAAPAPKVGELFGTRCEATRLAHDSMHAHIGVGSAVLCMPAKLIGLDSQLGLPIQVSAASGHSILRDGLLLDFA